MTLLLKVDVPPVWMPCIAYASRPADEVDRIRVRRKRSRVLRTCSLDLSFMRKRKRRNAW